MPNACLIKAAFGLRRQARAAVKFSAYVRRDVIRYGALLRTSRIEELLWLHEASGLIGK